MKKAVSLLTISLVFVAAIFAQTGQPPDSCQNTWLKLWGKPGTIERGITLCPTGDGNLYVTGTTPDSALLLKVNPDGDVIWARSFDFFPGFDRISHLTLDSDGMLLGCGNSNSSFSGAINSFFFKYNPQTDVFLWIFQPSFFSIIARGVGSIREKQPGGNYFVSFQSRVAPGAGVIMEIDRQTGLEVPGSSWRYNWGAGNFSPSFIVHGASMIITGGSSVSSGGTSRQVLICVDTSDGQVKWSQLNHLPLSESARLLGEDVIVDDDALISVYGGNDQSGLITPDFIFLQKTSLDGERLWLKKYDFPTFLMEEATELIRVSDGYVLFGGSRVYFLGQEGLFIMKTDFDGNVLWARHFHYSDQDFAITANRDQEFLEMDGFFYFTAYSADSGGETDLLLAKLNSEGLVKDSCAYIIDTPVETYTITDAVSETPPLEFTNVDIETATPLPIAQTAVPDALKFQTICEQVCVQEEGCDVKINGCVKFELLSIVVDAAGDRHYRVRFTNSCAGQNLEYLAVQLPKGTVAVGPADGSNYVTTAGHSYTVRNPNFSPFYSIRFKSSGTGIGKGESDVFEYSLIGQAQPDYIHVFARLSPGPSYEAHLNVFNCPVEYLSVQNRGSSSFTPAYILPNPASSILTVSLLEECDGQWQIYSLAGQNVSTGTWSETSGFTISIADLTPGMYFIRMHQDGVGESSQRFVKVE